MIWETVSVISFVQSCDGDESEREREENVILVSRMYSFMWEMFRLANYKVLLSNALVDHLDGASLANMTFSGRLYPRA